MNFKKFVSSLSALTIAASAFAGMAVTASAVYVPTGDPLFTGTTTSAKAGKNPNVKTVSLANVISSDTTGIINISYAVSTDVDYTTKSNREGYITLKGADSSGADVYIADFYANTARTGITYNQAGYSIGGQIATGGTASRLSTTDKSFNYDLYLDLDNNKISGTITGESTNITIPSTDMDIASLTEFYLYSGSSANTVTLSDVSIKSVTWQDVAPVQTAVIISGLDSIENGSGKSFQLFASVEDQFGQPMNSSVSWSSNNTEVATIDAATGIATVVGEGSVTFTASTDKINGTKTVTVLPKPERDPATTIVSEDYSGFEDGANLVKQTDAEGTIEAVSEHGITYNQGGRNNGSNNTNMAVSNGQGVVTLGNPASASRVPRMTFDNAIAVGDVISTNAAAEVLEFDLTFAAKAYEMVRVYDGTSVGSKSYETVVTNTIATIENTEDGVLFGTSNTGLTSENTLHVTVILDANAAYIEIKDTVTGITYAGFGTKTDKIGGIVFGNDTSNMTMYVDNIEYYVHGRTSVPAAASALTTVQAPWTAGDGTYAEAFTFMVTPNDQTVTGVKVAVAGQEQSRTFADGVEISGGTSVMFGILAKSIAQDKLPGADAFTVTLDVE